LDLVYEIRPTILLPWIAGINLSCYSHRPYVIDLESTNGTYVNNQRIEPARYYELKEKDMIKFGFSSREYILLHENSKGNMPDDVERQT